MLLNLSTAQSGDDLLLLPGLPGGIRFPGSSRFEPLYCFPISLLEGFLLRLLHHHRFAIRSGGHLLVSVRIDLNSSWTRALQDYRLVVGGGDVRHARCRSFGSRNLSHFHHLRLEIIVHLAEQLVREFLKFNTST